MPDLPDRADARGAPWWRLDGALARFLVDLLMSEAHALRPGGPVPALPSFTMDTMLGEAGLGFDSLECLAMAAALSEALFLHDSGLDDSLAVGSRLGDWYDAVMAALERRSTRVCFRSSGSTGMRQRSVHKSADLDAEVAFFAGRLGDRRRVVITLPCHHIYGFLFSLMLPAQLDVPVLDMRGRFPGVVAAALRPGDLVVGHPGFWTEMTRAAPDGWPQDVVGVTSGAPCPDDVARAVLDAGLSRLLQVYGSSETAGIGWRDDHCAPYRLLPAWQAAADGSLSKCGAVQGIDAPDHLRWIDPAHFVLEGRRDAAVQVGGLNVHPGHVRRLLREHPAVADAAVRLMSPHEGGRLKAFIVPRDPSATHETLRRDLHAHAERRLTVAERPRALSFGPSLPVTAAGKPADWPLPAG